MEVFESILIEEYTQPCLSIEFEATSDVALSEFISQYLDAIFLEVLDNLTFTESTEALIENLFSPSYDDLAIIESVSANFDILNLSILGEIAVSEYTELLDITIELGILSDLVSIEEDISILEEYLLPILNIVSVSESISLDLIINTGVADNVLIIESAYVLDIIVEVFIYEIINSVDRGFIFRVENFAEFLRGYPLIEITESGVDKIEFEDGVLQMVDRWGRNRKRFEITMPISTKDEAMPVKEFFERNIGRRFYFTNPLDNKTYNVTFEESSYRLSRSHFNTYEAELVLVEVF